MLCNNPELRKDCNHAKRKIHPDSDECSGDEVATWLQAVQYFYSINPDITKELLNREPMTSLDSYHTSAMT